MARPDAGEADGIPDPWTQARRRAAASGMKGQWATPVAFSWTARCRPRCWGGRCAGCRTTAEETGGRCVSDNRGGRDLTVTTTLGVRCRPEAGWRSGPTAISNLGALWSRSSGQNIQSALYSKVADRHLRMCQTYRFLAATAALFRGDPNTTQVDAYRGAGRPGGDLCAGARDGFRRARAGRRPAGPCGGGKLYRQGRVPRGIAVPRRGVVRQLGRFSPCSRPRRRSEARHRRGFEAAPPRHLRRAEAGCGAPRAVLLTDRKASWATPRRDRDHRDHRRPAPGSMSGTRSNGHGDTERPGLRPASARTRPGPAARSIEIVQGDSDLIAKGTVTAPGGSRSVTVQGMAMRATADTLITPALPVPRRRDGPARTPAFDPDEGVFDAPLAPTWSSRCWRPPGAARAAGKAELARGPRRPPPPTPCPAAPTVQRLATSRESEIDSRHRAATPCSTATRWSTISATSMNPRLAEGAGSMAASRMGIGQALTEHVVYDADGQLFF